MIIIKNTSDQYQAYCTCRNPRHANLISISVVAHCVYATFFICLLRYAAIINYNVCVSFSFHLLSARLSHGTCVQRLHSGSSRRRGRKRRMCNWVIYEPPREAQCGCLRTLARFSRQRHTHTHAKNQHQNARPVWGNCKLVSLNINALSNPNRSERSLHNCRV